MLRILAADDRAVVRKGIKQILAEANNNAYIGEAGNLIDLRNLLGEEP